jgi:hypothetical protein
VPAPRAPDGLKGLLLAAPHRRVRPGSACTPHRRSLLFIRAHVFGAWTINDR